MRLLYAQAHIIYKERENYAIKIIENRKIANGFFCLIGKRGGNSYMPLQ